MCTPETKKIGASPAHLQWTIVRGDSASLRIDFLENDEATAFNTDGWKYKATAYDSSGNVLDDLFVEDGPGYVNIYATPSITANWGDNYRPVVLELPFDVQVELPEDCNEEVWTPVIGTICVLGDVSPGGSL